MTTTATTPGSAGEPQSRPSEAMTPARAPVGTGASPLFGLLLAFALIALGVVGVQEALVRTEAINETSWTTWVLIRLDGVRPANWMVIVFVVSALLGLVLLVLALRPRPRKAIALRATTGVYLRSQDLARIADSFLEGIDGVTDASASATRHRLKVSVTTVEPKEHNTTLSGTVRERLQPCMDPLARAPKVRVSIKNEELS